MRKRIFYVIVTCTVDTTQALSDHAFLWTEECREERNLEKATHDHDSHCAHSNLVIKKMSSETGFFVWYDRFLYTFSLIFTFLFKQTVPITLLFYLKIEISMKWCDLLFLFRAKPKTAGKFDTPGLILQIDCLIDRIDFVYHATCGVEQSFGWAFRWIQPITRSPLPPSKLSNTD